VDFERLSWREAESFNLAAYDVGKQEGFTVDLVAGGEFALQARAAAETIVDSPLDRSSLIRRMLDVVPNPWQGARILDEALAKLRKRASEEEIIVARLTLVENIKRDIHKRPRPPPNKNRPRPPPNKHFARRLSPAISSSSFSRPRSMI
jgi:hypothetical protein